MNKVKHINTIGSRVFLLALLTAFSTHALAKGKPDANQAAATAPTEMTAEATEVPAQTADALAVAETATQEHVPDGFTISAEEQMALALSKRPKVVGKAKLDKEARGLRKLSKQAISNWRKGRLNPDFSTN